MLCTINRFGYELRLYDQAGYAYRGPMLSAATPAEKFWSQVASLTTVPTLNIAFAGVSFTYPQFRGSWKFLRNHCQNFSLGLKIS